MNVPATTKKSQYQSTTKYRKASLLSPTIYLVVPLLAFEGSNSPAVWHQNHVCQCSRAGCVAVMGGDMRVLEKAHVVAWLWLAGAEKVGAHDETLVYFVALSYW